MGTVPNGHGLATVKIVVDGLKLCGISSAGPHLVLSEPYFGAIKRFSLVHYLMSSILALLSSYRENSAYTLYIERTVTAQPSAQINKI